MNSKNFLILNAFSLVLIAFSLLFSTTPVKAVTITIETFDIPDEVPRNTDPIADWMIDIHDNVTLDSDNWFIRYKKPGVPVHWITVLGPITIDDLEGYSEPIGGPSNYCGEVKYEFYKTSVASASQKVTFTCGGPV